MYNSTLGYFLWSNRCHSFQRLHHVSEPRCSPLPMDWSVSHLSFDIPKTLPLTKCPISKECFFVFFIVLCFLLFVLLIFWCLSFQPRQLVTASFNTSFCFSLFFLVLVLYINSPLKFSS